MYKSGDVILFHTKSKWYKPGTWLPWLIRKFTKSEYNHVGVVVSNWDQLFLNEAIGHGIVTSLLSDRLKGRQGEYIVLRSFKKINEKEFCVKANSLLGKKYDKKSLLIYFPFYILFKRWAGSTEEQQDDKMTCSQYAAWCHNIEDFSLVAPVDFLFNDDFEVI